MSSDADSADPWTEAHKAEIRRDDPIVVLRVGGENFDAYLSTLTRVGGSYFAARFGNTTNDMTPGGVYGQDQWGRTIYFIDRDPELFRCILEFLRTGEIENMLPQPYLENKGFWSRLRDEAMFYGLDDLATNCEPPVHSCPPNSQNRGVLYLLGTDYGRETYSNPHMSGKVHVGGWCDESLDTEETGERYKAGSALTRSMFVQHRPQCKAPPDPEYYIDVRLVHSDFTPCFPVDDGWTATVALRNASLCPTHYSLRYECCDGLDAPWIFEASTDGKEWEPLQEHEGGIEHDFDVAIRREENEASSVSEDEYATNMLERYERFIWKVKSTDSFYGFFRVRANTNGDAKHWHGTGLEMFGNLREL